MPRTKRPKKVQPTKSKQTGKIEIDPNIVIKQEPEDLPPESMEYEFDFAPDNDIPLQVLKVEQSDNLGTVEQLQKLVADMHKKRKQIFEQKKQSISSAIHLMKMKIPPQIKNAPIADLIMNQGMSLNASNDLLSVSQRIESNDSTINTAEQTTKTFSDHLQKEQATGNKTGAPCTTSKFETPAVGVPTPRFGTITPKVGPDSPITILRRPKMGEIVVSMKGSPVMLNAAREDKPTLNIPMTNGTVISILPDRSLRAAQLPEQMDPETQENLKAILENLKDLVGNH